MRLLKSGKPFILSWVFPFLWWFMSLNKRNEDAVSPVIGVILIAIIIILAAVTAVFVFGLGGPKLIPPSPSITGMSYADTPEPDIKIMHKGGDILAGGDWKLSIVPVGQPVTFVTANSSAQFKVGDQLVVSNSTIGATDLNSTTLIGGQPLERGIYYDVKLIQYPSQVLLLDEVVEVR